MLNINVAMPRVITSISKENQVTPTSWLHVINENKTRGEMMLNKENDVFTPFRTKYVSNYLCAWNEKYIVFNEIISYTYSDFQFTNNITPLKEAFCSM